MGPQGSSQNHRGIRGSWVTLQTKPSKTWKRQREHNRSLIDRMRQMGKPSPMTSPASKCGNMTRPALERSVHSSSLWQNGTLNWCHIPFSKQELNCVDYNRSQLSEVHGMQWFPRLSANGGHWSFLETMLPQASCLQNCHSWNCCFLSCKYFTGYDKAIVLRNWWQLR